MGVRSTNSTQSFFDDFFRSGTDAVKESVPLINSPITATGGDSTLTITGYKVHIFTTTGPATLNVSSGGGEVEYLVVAGGGSGSAQYGGGGGAGAVGEDAPSVRGGNGGVGVQCLIAGNPSPIGTPGPSGTGWFAGGGGGGGYNVDPGSGGAGGGAASGSIPSPAGGNGTANTGGGGGGGFHPGATTGGNGGSGIVVIRYPTS